MADRTGLTLLDQLDRIPPCLCRLLASSRNGWVGLSHSQLAARADMPRSSVAGLSIKTSWNGVPISIASKFAAACGIDLLRPKRLASAVRHRKKLYLKRANPQQRKMYIRLANLLKTKDALLRSSTVS